MNKIKYTEIFKLKDMLEKANIEYEFIDRSMGDIESYQIIVRNNEVTLEDCLWDLADYESYSRLASVIQGNITYGGNLDLLEIMGLTENNEDVEGYLTSDEVFKRINKAYKKENKND